jgi:hypothetical protein
MATEWSSSWPTLARYFPLGENASNSTARRWKPFKITSASMNLEREHSVVRTHNRAELYQSRRYPPDFIGGFPNHNFWSGTHLARGHEITTRMHSQTDDVIRVIQIVPAHPSPKPKHAFNVRTKYYVEDTCTHRCTWVDGVYAMPRPAAGYTMSPSML